MEFAPHLNAALPGTVRLGPLRLPVYGLFATAGMLGALALSQKTARRVGLRADVLWDAGVVGVVAAFVASRVLLVAQNWAVFKAMPMLVLTLPSLTYGGAALAVVAVIAWLKWKREPVLRAMDAWTPCAALLAGFLQLGHFFEGTDAGMPTRLPWGVIAPGDTVLGRTHPVQLYAVVAAAVLGVWWWRMLRFPGRAAAVALMSGGAVSFALDMLRQPFDSGWAWPLEASQMVAVGAMVAGVGVWAMVDGGGSECGGLSTALRSGRDDKRSLEAGGSRNKCGGLSAALRSGRDDERSLEAGESGSECGGLSAALRSGRDDERSLEAGGGGSKCGGLSTALRSGRDDKHLSNVKTVEIR